MKKIASTAVQVFHPEVVTKEERKEKLRIIEDAEPLEGPRQKKNSAIDESFYVLSKPMVLTNFFVNKPGTAIGIIGTFILICVGICVAFGYFNPDAETNRDYLIWDDIRTVQYDKT